MKTYPHLFTKLFCQPLILRDCERQTFERHLLSRMGNNSTVIMGAEIPKPKAQSVDDMAERQSRIYWRAAGSDVAVVHIDGVIDKRISEMEMECYGGVDLLDVDAVLGQIAADKTITRLVLDINSPGGSVVGVQETYDRIAKIAQTKEVHAYINCMACSGGYYLAGAADHIAAASSAIVGSIGVYIAILDASKAAQMQGLNMQMIKAGEQKDTGSQWRPLTDAEKARLQAEVDAIHAQFKAAVTANREIDPAAMEGQWMNAEQGATLGLVDELTGETLDEYVSRLLLT